MILEENNRELQKLKNLGKYNAIKKAKRRWILNRVKRYLVYSLLALLSYFIFFRPTETGYVIGRWMNDFFGTIVKESTK